MSITKALFSTLTDTPTPGKQNISLNTLPLGRYLAYTKIQKGEGSPLYIISETGQKIGDIALGGGDYTISYNQKYIAYNHSGEVEIFNIEQEETFNLQITEPCYFGAVELTWNDRGDELAFPCGTEIFVISVPESSQLTMPRRSAFTSAEKSA